MTIRILIYDYSTFTMLLTVDGRAYGRYHSDYFESRWGWPPNTIVGDFCPL